MANWEFLETEAIDLDISLISGQIAISGEPTEALKVSVRPSGPGRGAEEFIAGLRVEYAHGRLEIAEPRNLGLRQHSADVSLAVTVPVGSRCSVRAAASDVTCLGELGSLDVRTGSGDITAALVSGPVQVHTISGDVQLDEAAAQVNANTGSGDIRLQRAGGDFTATTASGNIQIGTANASATARTASGDIRIASIATGRADLVCVSGDIAVGVAPGAGVYLDLASVTGRVSSELAEPAQDGRADLHLKCRTVNGDLRVSRAVPVGDTR